MWLGLCGLSDGAELAVCVCVRVVLQVVVEGVPGGLRVGLRSDGRRGRGGNGAVAA